MSGRRRQSLSPTLFPFLAVLVCTLGTLILLLALVAQNTTDAAQQIAEQKASAAPDVTLKGQLSARQAGELIAEEQFLLNELVSMRDEQTADLERRRDELAHVEDHMRRVRERLKEISLMMERATSDDQVGVVSDAEILKLQKQLAQDEATVKKLREEVDTQKPRVVIVPHQGPNGTSRRPIYLECTAEGVTIWPEDVKISRWQLQNSSSRINPLDDALRAARYHALQTYGDTVPPYPMLLVRPDGVKSYFEARAAMREWDDQFGYELVPDEVTLAYPNPDPQMKERLLYAINATAAKMERQSIARITARAGYGGGSRGRLEVGGRRSGGNIAGGEDRMGDEQLAGGDDPDGYATSGDARSATSPGQPSAASSLAPSPGSSGGKKPQPFSVSQMDRQGRQSGYSDHRTFAIPTYVAGSGYGESSSTVTPEQAKQRLERQLTGSENLLKSMDPDSSLNEAANQIARDVNGRQQTSAGAVGSIGKDQFSETSTSEQSSRGGAGQSQVGQTMQQPNASGASASPSSRMPSSNMASADPNQARQAPPPSASSSTTGNPPSQPPVRRSGADWALPRNVALSHGNHIVRSIRLQLYPDRMVLIPASRSGLGSRAQVFDMRGDLNQATLQMATAVRDRVDSWGAAIPGGRWAPRLQVDVAPGAESQFRQLQRLMSGSGIDVQPIGNPQAPGGQVFSRQTSNSPQGVSR